MSASSPNPRYFKDGNGSHPRLLFRLRHPISALRFTPLNRVRVWWHDRGYTPKSSGLERRGGDRQ